LDTISLFIVAMGLAMNCFGLAIANSSLSGKLLPGISIKTAFLFGLSHFAMGVAGFYLGRLLLPAVGGVEIWAATILLVILGAKILFQAMRVSPEAKVFDINSIRVILALSIATAMNALLVGLALGFFQAHLLKAQLFTFFAVAFFTLSGLTGGHRLGMAFARNVSILGGVLFVAAGIRIAIEYYFLAR